MYIISVFLPENIQSVGVLVGWKLDKKTYLCYNLPI